MEKSKVLETFKELSKVPRDSKKEDKIRDWLIEYAKREGWEYKVDKVGNLLIKVPGGKDRTVVLQAHMDMVCQKDDGVEHDFTEDSLEIYEEDGWLKAEGTTLGADNGIGIALSLEIAREDRSERPNLELLFTVDEESGFTGVFGLKEDFLTGDILINLDSEDEGVFTIGCAGGVRMTINKDYDLINRSGSLIDLRVEGGLGGHSGVDIHKGRANAAKIIARVLYDLREIDFSLLSVELGTVFNSIPGSGVAKVIVDDHEVRDFLSLFEEKVDAISDEYKSIEDDLDILMKVKESNDYECLSTEDSLNLVDFLISLPDGVFNMSQDVEGLVETSSNIGVVKLEDGTVELKVLSRGSSASKLELLVNKFLCISNSFDYTVERGNGYPGWKPNPESKLLKQAVKIYQDLYQKEPAIEAIHAGLECGLIGSKYEGMDMISIGPTVKGAHTTDERLKIESLDKVYGFLKRLLADL